VFEEMSLGSTAPGGCKRRGFAPEVREPSSSQTADQQRIYNDLQPFMPGRRKPDLLDLYKAASVAYKLRSQELDGTSTRGTKRQRIIAPRTELLSKLIEQGMTTERLRQLATVRQAWPTKKQFVEQVIKPSGSDGFQLSLGHVLRLAALCKNDAEIKLRRELIAAAIEHKWTVAQLWERIRDGRKQLDKKRPARKKRAGS
jgi:hypothetical protein